MESGTSRPDRFDGTARDAWRLVYGAIVACLGASAFWSHLEGGVPESRIAAVAMLAGGLLLGVVLAFAPSGARLDFRRGTYRAWLGWSLPWLGKRGRLDEIQRIDVQVRRVRSARSAIHVHVLSAQRQGQAPLEIGWIDSYEAARRAGETLARRLKVPFCDAKSGEGVIRAAADLDRPLHRRSDRRRRHGTPRIAAPPAGSRITFAVDRPARSLRVQIAPPRFRLEHLAPLLILAGLALVPMFLPFRRHHLGPRGGLWAFLCFLGVALLVLLLGVLASATRQTLIEAGPEGLRVRWQSWLSTRERRLPRESIEELLIGQAPSGQAWYTTDFFPDAVLARSDRETIALGGHLSAKEKRWLRDALEEALLD